MHGRKYRMLLLRVVFLPIAVLLAICFASSWKLETWAEFWIELMGYIFLLTGLGIRNWATLYIGGRKSRQLVGDGPYSLCRHPLYWGTFFLGIGVGLCFSNIPMLIALVIVLVPIHYFTLIGEEKHLEKLFPQEYPAYKQKVPRFIPRFKNYHSEKWITVSISAIRRISLETVGVLMIPLLEDLLEILRESGVLPIVRYFP